MKKVKNLARSPFEWNYLNKGGGGKQILELAETQLKPFISGLWNLLSGPGINWIKNLQAEPRRWRNCLCPLETFKASNVGQNRRGENGSSNTRLGQFKKKKKNSFSDVILDSVQFESLKQDL